MIRIFMMAYLILLGLSISGCAADRYSKPERTIIEELEDALEEPSSPGLHQSPVFIANGDKIEIRIFEPVVIDSDYTTRAIVKNDGVCSFPHLGVFRCGGLRPETVENQVEDVILSQKLLFINPVVEVSIISHEPIPTTD
ncbi:MAG: polysaccharide biosynthesis/export family protein [Planctomycetota bacterium]